MSESFMCPTSGQMLGTLVKAFRLHVPEVGGTTASFIGSGDDGRNSRKYFNGEWIPKSTRIEICTWTVRAIIHSGLIPALRIPNSEPDDVADFDEILHKTIFTWLKNWDEVYVTALKRWPQADPVLSGFVLGRQTVIDAALRFGALCHFAGISDPSTFHLEDGRAGNGMAILRPLIDESGRKMTREELARALRNVRPGKINDRTVDRWLDELVVPDDDNLKALAEVLATEVAHERRTQG